MSLLCILQKGEKLQHVYGRQKRDRMIEDGWKVMMFINGFNMSVIYRDEGQKK